MKRKLLLFFISITSLNLSSQTILNYTTADGLVSNFVECIAVDLNGNAWFGTSIGVQKFDGSNWTLYNSSDFNLSTDNIKVITAASNGDVYIGTDFGSSRFDGNNWIAFNTNSQIKSIDEDPNGGIWLGTNQGVQHYDGTSSIYYSSPDLHWSGVNSTAFDSNGDTWFASPLGGITHFDGVNFTDFDTANGLLSQFVTYLIIDSQDNKWVGTSSGMSVLDASNTSFTQHTRMYLMPPPDTLNPIVNIDMDSWGRIWTSIYVGYLAEGGIAYWDGNQWEDYDVNDGLAGPNVKGLTIDNQDNIWVATSTGVSKISNMPSAIHNNKSMEVNLFPNPCSNVVYLSNIDNEIKNIKIYDNLGSLVYANSKSQFNYVVSTISLSRGLYYFNIEFSDAIIRKKLVIN